MFALPLMASLCFATPVTTGERRAMLDSLARESYPASRFMIHIGSSGDGAEAALRAAQVGLRGALDLKGDSVGPTWLPEDLLHSDERLVEREGDRWLAVAWISLDDARKALLRSYRQSAGAWRECSKQALSASRSEFVAALPGIAQSWKRLECLSLKNASLWSSGGAGNERSLNAVGTISVGKIPEEESDRALWIQVSNLRAHYMATSLHLGLSGLSAPLQESMSGNVAISIQRLGIQFLAGASACSSGYELRLSGEADCQGGTMGSLCRFQPMATLKDCENGRLLYSGSLLVRPMQSVSSGNPETARQNLSSVVVKAKLADDLKRILSMIYPLSP